MKVCTKCKEYKPFSEFYTHKTEYQCKSCFKEYYANKCPFKKWFASKKSRAKMLGIEFTIKPTDMPGVNIRETITEARGRKYTSWEAIEYPKVCPVFGVELDWGMRGKNGSHKSNSPSLDRIDSTKGYIPGNVMMMSVLANTMKNNATPEQLVKFSKYMLSEHGE